MAELEILYQDQHLVVVNKPSGMMVHRSAIAADAETFVLQQLRDQIEQRVYPVHRLDRPTSGALLFALNSDYAALLAQQFAEQEVKKSYLAVVRGWLPEPVRLDHPLKVIWDPYGDRGKRPDKPPQSAATRFEPVAFAQRAVDFGRYPTARYSLVRAFPESGRKHQIRRHLKHLAHPIIGDVKYGKGEHNRYFREQWALTHLLLHAESITFTHPVTMAELCVQAPLRAEFQRVIEALGWQEVVGAPPQSLAEGEG